MKPNLPPLQKRANNCGMADQTTIEEFNEAQNTNARIDGRGFDVTMHTPCPFCSAAGFRSYKIIDANKEHDVEVVCKSCGRGAKLLIGHTEDGLTSTIRMVQTRGEDPPAFLAGLIPRT